MAGAHISETALAGVPDENWDAILVNDSNLETFRERALFIFSMLMSSVPSTRPASV
jgi:hypothetical protein